MTGLTEAGHYRADSLFCPFRKRQPNELQTKQSKAVCSVKPKLRSKDINITNESPSSLPSPQMLNLLFEKCRPDIEISDLYHNIIDEEYEDENEDEWVYDYINGSSESSIFRKKLVDDSSASIISLSSDDTDDEAENTPIFQNFAELSRILLAPKRSVDERHILKRQRSQNVDKDTKYAVAGFLRQLTPSLENVDDLIFDLSESYVFDNDVFFDKKSETIHLSSNGFKFGVHEWEIRFISFGDRMGTEMLSSSVCWIIIHH